MYIGAMMEAAPIPSANHPPNHELRQATGKPHSGRGQREAGCAEARPFFARTDLQAPQRKHASHATDQCTASAHPTPTASSRNKDQDSGSPHYHDVVVAKQQTAEA